MRAGILEAREGDGDVRAGHPLLRAALTEDQKQTLLAGLPVVRARERRGRPRPGRHRRARRQPDGAGLGSGWRAVRRLAVLSLHTSPLVQPGAGDSGGMNVYVRELVSSLAQAGVACDVYTRRGSPDLPAR